jgi:DNA polymerase elongation subunit (family B)
MGNIYFRYYDIRIAEGITMTGQFVIRSVANSLNKFINKESKTNDINYSFYSDTDSTYITLGRYIDVNFKDGTKSKIVNHLDEYCNSKIEPVINETCDDLSEYLNVYLPKIKFKREVIADTGIWLAKKRYALNVYNAEGVAYDPPKLKVLGMEIVRSSTPAPVRKALKEAVGIVLTKDEPTVKKFVQDLESEWNKLKPEDIAFPRSVNGLKEYSDKSKIFRKGAPIHVRGALIYNHLIQSRDLEKKYQYIQEGDKIKFLYLREPNTLGSHVITFIGGLPVELDLHKYVDYDKMFEKSFLEPLNSLLSVIGWRLKEQATLEGLFG